MKTSLGKKLLWAAGVYSAAGAAVCIYQGPPMIGGVFIALLLIALGCLFSFGDLHPGDSRQ